MILAGIDIGTNTLRLLIAETGSASLHEIHSDRRITRLGEQLDLTNQLSSLARERSLKALADFSEKIKKYTVDDIAAVGTSALRNAANSAEFIRDVYEETGLKINVISGREEARLTLLGVSRALSEMSLESAIVIDIGGGSTEIISGGMRSQPADVSLPLGAVYLTERFIQNDPPAEEELDLLREFIRAELRNVPFGVDTAKGGGSVLAGTAGTITTLAAIDQKLPEYLPEKINGSVLTIGSIDQIVAKLRGTPLKERGAIPGLEPGREDIILAGAVITQEIMRRFGFAELRVSDWGLREGILFDLYEQQGDRKSSQVTST
jgi:exopolyphosphatase/guanosine-5'-triphosphate,3'-diphosphate pyrophosphatase